MVDTMRSYNQFKDTEGKVHTIYQGRDMVVVNGSKYYSLNYLTSKETTMTTRCHECYNEIEIKTVPIQTVVCPVCGATFELQMLNQGKKEG